MTMPTITHLQTASGSDAPNQLVLSAGKFKVFLSYGEVIAIQEGNTDYYINRDLWSYSATTLRYLKQFLHTSKTKNQLAKVFEQLEEFHLTGDDNMKDHYRSLFVTIA